MIVELNDDMTQTDLDKFKNFIWKTEWTDFIESVLDEFVFDQEPFKIVQVGSNDGLFFDPLFFSLLSFGWKTQALFVEAQSDLVPILQNNYKFHKNALFANELISDGDEKIFYSFKPEYYKNYTYNLKEQNYLIHADIEEYMEPTGVATIHKDGLLKHYEKYFNNKNLRFEDVINTENKKSITLEELLLKYNFSFDIDLLCINTEKEDINILLNNNWELIQPQIIFFECEHNTYEETSRVIKLLENQGYKIKEITWLTKQMLAIKK